jgi:hypothetical protein
MLNISLDCNTLPYGYNMSYLNTDGFMSISKGSKTTDAGFFPSKIMYGQGFLIDNYWLIIILLKHSKAIVDKGHNRV